MPVSKGIDGKIQITLNYSIFVTKIKNRPLTAGTSYSPLFIMSMISCGCWLSTVQPTDWAVPTRKIETK